MGFDELMERIRRRIRELFEEISEELEKVTPMWSPDGSLEPLVSTTTYHDRYEVIIDLPYADLNALSLTVKDRILLVECQLRREVKFERWGAYKEIGFRRYRTTIKLPEDADIDNIKVEKDYEKRMIRIIIPRKRA